MGDSVNKVFACLAVEPEDIDIAAGPVADEDCGFVVEIATQSPANDDLALLVSATNDVVHDFTLSRTDLALRGVVHVKLA